MSNLTPMMKQYMDIKNQHKDAILFFRLGDFYEVFFDDAIIAAKELEITLTQRNAGFNDKAPMCGVPHHVADTYISRLVEKGYKVAICDQVEDPATAKGIVKREVIRVVTPGTITDNALLNDKVNNNLASIYFDSIGLGLAYVDISTGDMYVTEIVGDSPSLQGNLIDELGKIYPSEIITNENLFFNKRLVTTIKNTLNPFINTYKNNEYKLDIENTILKHFKLDSLDQVGLSSKALGIAATGKLLEYLYTTQKSTLDHIKNLTFYEPNKYMVIDIYTRTNLEIHETIMRKSKKGSLIGLIDMTETSMGGRLLKKWLDQPLISQVQIEERQNLVGSFLDDIEFMDDISKVLKNIYDIERLGSKISTGNTNGRDLVALKSSIGFLPSLKEDILARDNPWLNHLVMNLDCLEDLYELIQASIVDNPPINISEGGLIKKGYNSQLDEILEISKHGKEWLLSLEAKEKENTGIKNLKIGYNKIYGYYFEVTKSNLASVPDYFIRRQTLTNAERYYTEELKSMEDKILGAEEKAQSLEYEIFVSIRETIKTNVQRIHESSKIIGQLDVLNSFAKAAYKYDYTRPVFNDQGKIIIKDGRHPVVENNLVDGLFVPNNTLLDREDNMVQIITGPNMAGKSTYMRQVGIIVLLGHIGSYVPAKYADLSIVDRIFTRIGASDNLAQGESTFMVEMNEVSNILSSASEKSLIILDEVGRGTSTYDGLSIAWAVVEHLVKEIKAKSMFATHYHELTQLKASNKGIVNLTIVAEEKDDEIIFLRKIVEGSTNKSYGIEVAKLAGIDKSIINRANEVLSIIENNHEINLNSKPKESKQLSLTDYRKDYFLDRILSLDIDNMTPREAQDRLYTIYSDAKNLKGDNND